MSCRTAVQCAVTYTRTDWNVRMETALTCSADATHFHLTGTLRAFDNGALFAARDFDEHIPRDFM